MRGAPGSKFSRARPRPSAAVLLGALAAALYLGLPYFAGLAALVIALAAYEYLQLWHRAGLELPWWVLFPLAGFWLLRYGYPRVPALELGLLLGVLAGLGGLACLRAASRPWAAWALAIAGALWLGFLPSYLLLLYRAVPAHLTALCLLLLAVSVSVVGDTLAYFVGTAVGRHRFFPWVSPKKTWEGALAGWLGPTVMVGLLLPLVLPRTGHPAAFLVGAVASAAAIAGDLVESQLKREVGVKDSGTLVPGHGGVLDRVDSLLFVGAVVYSLLGATHAF